MHTISIPSTRLLPVLFSAVLLTTACQPKDDTIATEVAGEHGGEGDEHGEGAEDVIHLSRRQVEGVEMRFGVPTDIQVGSAVEAAGTLGLPPNGYSTVAALADAFVRDAGEHVEGDYVKKGAVLARLENPEFVVLQQTYLEANSELTFLRQELERQAELVAQNAGVKRKLQEAEANVAKQEATLAGLADRLRFFGIDPGRVTISNITRLLSVRAPRSGYISKISVNDGMFVTARDQLMEIIDTDHVHLELDIFESDIDRVKVGQRISYSVPAMGGDSIYAAEVHVIGKEFDSVKKTVRVHGHLIGSRPPFIKDLFIEARIFDRMSTQPAVPEAAVIQDGDAHYVYATKDFAAGGPTDAEIEFTRLRVVTTGQFDKYTAIRLLDPLPAGAKLVLEGAYYVYAQSKAGGLSDDH